MAISEGFIPDRNPEKIIHGVAIVFFLTSCCLAFMVFPGLFSSNTFIAANDPEYVPPAQQQILDLGIIIGNHLGWMLGAFMVSGFLMRKRRIGVYLAGILLAVAVWRFKFIPLSFPGQVLMVIVWAISTGIVVCYWNNLD